MYVRIFFLKSLATEATLVQQARARHICASFCTILGSCDGYYIEEDSDGKDCQIIDEHADPLLMRTTRPDIATTYYVRKAGNEQAKSLREDPYGFKECDAEPIKFSQGFCDAMLPKAAKTTYECDWSGADYRESVDEISDRSCDGEDRLRRCEMLAVGGLDSIDNEATIAAFDPVDIDEVGYVGSGVRELHMILNGNYTISRVIIRSIGAGGRDHLAGSTLVMINREGEQARMDMSMSDTDCAVMLRPEYSNDEYVANLAKSINRLELRNMTWISDTGNNAFKMDVFVKPEVVDLYWH